MGLAAWGLSAAAGWAAVIWSWALLVLAPLLVLSTLLVLLGLRPPIETRERHLVAGRRAIPWSEIRQVSGMPRVTPLVIRLGLADGSQVRLVYPGDAASRTKLLQQICASARAARGEARSYRELRAQEAPPPAEPHSLRLPRYRLLRPEDEEEVEKLYQRLKAVGRLDSKSSTDEI
jgi:hypothetical protein